MMIDPNKHWWAQAEAVVGFYNAYQVSGERRFADEAYRVWEYIEEKIVDRVHGEWHAKLKPRGTPYTEKEDGDACLVGPWKCPYHNSRVCYEMIERLAK
jgi:mannobiose 2-epimerase